MINQLSKDPQIEAINNLTDKVCKELSYLLKEYKLSPNENKESARAFFESCLYQFNLGIDNNRDSKVTFIIDKIMQKRRQLRGYK